MHIMNIMILLSSLERKPNRLKQAHIQGKNVCQIDLYPLLRESLQKSLDWELYSTMDFLVFRDNANSRAMKIPRASAVIASLNPFKIKTLAVRSCNKFIILVCNSNNT